MEILHVGGGEFGDALVAEGHGSAGVEKAAPGELRGGGVFPQGFVGGEGIGWVAQNAPAGVVAVGLNDLHGRRGGEGVGEKGGVAQLEIEFGQNEFAEDNVVEGGEAGQKGVGNGMLGRGSTESVEEEVSVEGGHRGAEPWRLGRIRARGGGVRRLASEHP